MYCKNYLLLKNVLTYASGITVISIAVCNASAVFLGEVQCSAHPSTTATIRLIITIDYPLLRSLSSAVSSCVVDFESGSGSKSPAGSASALVPYAVYNSPIS